jgi:hypothetical protein
MSKNVYILLCNIYPIHKLREVCHTVRTNIWIPDEIKVKIDAYNEKNKYAKINVSKIAQDAIVKVLSEAENTARA